MCLFLHSLLLLPVFILMASQATAVMRTMQSACCLKAAATCFSTSITSCTLAATALLCCISELSPWVSHTYGSHGTHTPTRVLLFEQDTTAFAFAATRHQHDVSCVSPQQLSPQLLCSSFKGLGILCKSSTQVEVMMFG